MKANTIAQIAGGLIVIALIIILITNTSQVKKEVKQDTIVGENIITLSWGKLNYNPEVITVEKGKPVTIKADLTRLTGCYRSFEIKELGVRKAFKEGDDTVTFTPDKEGTFRFGCLMGMGNGKIIVK